MLDVIVLLDQRGDVAGRARRGNVLERLRRLRIKAHARNVLGKHGDEREPKALVKIGDELVARHFLERAIVAEALLERQVPVHVVGIPPGVLQTLPEKARLANAANLMPPRDDPLLRGIAAPTRAEHVPASASGPRAARCSAQARAHRRRQHLAGAASHRASARRHRSGARRPPAEMPALRRSPHSRRPARSRPEFRCKSQLCDTGPFFSRLIAICCLWFSAVSSTLLRAALLAALFLSLRFVPTTDRVASRMSRAPRLNLVP